jgi:hypothetical protein
LRKKPLSSLASVYTNSENAIAAGFVTGHDFSRAANEQNQWALQAAEKLDFICAL